MSKDSDTSSVMSLPCCSALVPDASSESGPWYALCCLAAPSVHGGSGLSQMAVGLVEYGSAPKVSFIHMHVCEQRVE